MKKLFALFLAAMMVMVSSIAFSDEYFSSPYPYMYRWTGIVICSNISIRTAPSTNAKRLVQLHNGDVVTILGAENGWFTIDLASIGMPNKNNGVGYAKCDLIKPNPYWLVLTSYTNIYDDPWGGTQRNGEIVANTPLLVKNENDWYYCVQPHAGHAGSGFIRKSDVGRFTPECEPGYAVVVDGPIQVFDYEDKHVIGSLNNLDIVQVISYGTEFAHIYFTTQYAFVDAYVYSLNVQPILN